MRSEWMKRIRTAAWGLAAAKVAALIQCTGAPTDWEGEAKMDSTARKTGEEGNVLRFEVTPGDGRTERAFVRLAL